MARHAGTVEVYPAEQLGAPKDRHGHAEGTNTGLPPGTAVFSADNHISLSEDIFYERAPESLKERVPRVWFDDSWVIGLGDKAFLPKPFRFALEQYDPLPGASTGELETRIAQLEADGVTRELAFPNALLSLMSHPDLEIRATCFRIYNEYLAELQERGGGRFYGVGLMPWWDAGEARRALAEMKALGLLTFWLPLKAGNDAEGKPVDYNGPALYEVWEAVEESCLPVAHHIGEGTLSAPCATNTYAVAMVHNAAPFREMFGRYVNGGILDRTPGVRVGWFEGGINWVPGAIQDAGHMAVSFRHLLNVEPEHDAQYYWEHNMYSAFMVDPLGLDMIDRIGKGRVMWSTDFPHTESTFGYSERSLAAVVDAVGAEDAVAIVSRNVLDFLGLPA